MRRHILDVDIIPTNNEAVLHLFDTSVYDDNLTVTCARLEISIPGFKYTRLIEPAQNFNLAINAIDLELVDEGVEFLPPLPDGIYHIVYSISPNNEVYIEFDHLRSTMFERRLMIERCRLNLDDGGASEDIVEKLKIINEIENYLKAAIASVTVCEDSEKGLALFIYANQLLTRYSKTC